MENIKIKLLSVLGVVGSGITAALGGWDTGIHTLLLLLFMCWDYITGLVLAGVFKKSPKTANGALESKAGFKGLCRKGVALLIVLVAVRLDLMLDLGQLIRNAVVIGFVLNEVISIIENAGLMGVPIPPMLLNAIEMLKRKAEDNVTNAEKINRD